MIAPPDAGAMTLGPPKFWYFWLLFRLPQFAPEDGAGSGLVAIVTRLQPSMEKMVDRPPAALANVLWRYHR